MDACILITSCSLTSASINGDSSSAQYHQKKRVAKATKRNAKILHTTLDNGAMGKDFTGGDESDESDESDEQAFVS